jgi:hypothetical protein
LTARPSTLPGKPTCRSGTISPGDEEPKHFVHF